MTVEVLTDAGSVALRAASVIAEEAWCAAASRGRFILGVSGGRTPWLMLRELAAIRVPWPAVHVVQIDERIAPAAHTDRNLTHLHETLLREGTLRPEQLHAMPVESNDLKAAAACYAETLRKVAGSPAVLDLVHLGLGADGHTASLVPGDPVLEVEDRDVALTGVYQGRRRMTMTYPILNRARRVLWVATGNDKAEIVKRLLNGDQSIPAGRVRSDRALLLVDHADTADTSRAMA